MFFLTSFGVSTFHIIDKNQFYDILIEKEIYKFRINNKQHESVKDALKQAEAEKLPLISLGRKISGMQYACSFAEALGMIKEKTAVVFVNNESKEFEDVVVIVIDFDGDPDEAYAALEIVDDKLINSQSKISELYTSDGLVRDALGIIEAGIAVKYGLRFNNSWNEDILIDSSYNDKTEYVLQLADENIRISRVFSKHEKIQLPDVYLLPIHFRNENELLEAYQNFLKSKLSLRNFSVKCMKECLNAKEDEKIVSFVVDSQEQFISELQLFIKEKDNWDKAGYKWSTRNGSVFFSEPIGVDGKICFINPPGGMFSKVPFYRFYSLFPVLKQEIKNNRINNRSRIDLVNRYYFEIITIFLTIKALKYMGIELDAIIGGSLGEISIPLVLDSTESYDTPLEIKKSSADVMMNVIGILEDIIENQPKYSREYFGYDIKDMQKWYILHPYEDVKKYIDSLPPKSPIFIIIIGSPKDIVICGDETHCKNLIDNFKCYSLEFKDPIYAHTPILDAVFDNMKQKITKLGMHINKSNKFDVYGTYAGHKLGFGIDEFAENYAGCLIKQVNFPAIIKKSYDDGNRIYIDLGSSAFCNRWANETLKVYDDAYVFSPFEKITPYMSILAIMANLWANKIHFNRNQFIHWYSGGGYFDSDKLLTKKNQSELSDWKSEFWNKIVHNQLNRNESLFNHYTAILNKCIGCNNDIDTLHNEKNKVSIERECLYNYSQIIEMTNNSMSNVLGEKYKNEDKYMVRARMPLPPFLFVSRILEVNAEYGKLDSGSYILAEYDVTDDCILKMNDYCVSSVVFSEAAHIGIFLLGYMGIDDVYSGKTKFRITDVATKYTSDKWPVIGDTIKFKFGIKKVIKNGYNVLLVADYEVYLEDELIINAVETGGFFTEELLDSGVGIICSNRKQKLIEFDTKSLIYSKICPDKSFSRSMLDNFYNGNFVGCFGNKADSIKFDLKIKPEARFVDRIIEISEKGGRYGLGYVIAEKEIDSDFWAFKCHFKNDPVLPGTIMLDGLVQTFTFFQMYVGLYNSEKKLIPKMKTGLQIETKFRGEVKKSQHIIRYHLDIKMLEKKSDGLLINSDGSVYCDDVHIIEEKNISSFITE